MRDEILRNTQATLQVTFYSGGTATDADGDVLVTVLGDDAGTVVAGTAVAGGTGVYTYTLAPQSNLDLLTVSWAGTFGGTVQSVTTNAEITGAHYVSLADIRALRSLSSTATYPDSRLLEVRSWFADRAESFCGVSFVPRHARDVLDGDGTRTIMLSHLRPRVLEDAFVDDAEVTDLTDWELYGSGKVYRGDAAFTAGYRNVVIQYEHGYDLPPEDLREAALVAIRYKLLGDQSGIPERATTMATEVGTFNLALAGANRPTGIPEVDAVLIGLSKKVPLVG